MNHCLQLWIRGQQTTKDHGLANYSPAAKFGQAHSFTYYEWLFLHNNQATTNSYYRNSAAHKTENIYCLALCRKCLLTSSFFFNIICNKRGWEHSYCLITCFLLSLILHSGCPSMSLNVIVHYFLSCVALHCLDITKFI